MPKVLTTPCLILLLIVACVISPPEMCSKNIGREGGRVQNISLVHMDKHRIERCSSSCESVKSLIHLNPRLEKAILLTLTFPLPLPAAEKSGKLTTCGQTNGHFEQPRICEDKAEEKPASSILKRNSISHTTQAAQQRKHFCLWR